MILKRSGGGAEDGWLYRKCPQDNIGTGARLEKIKGKTLVWNQIVPVSSKSSFTSNGVTFTNNADGTWTANGTASAYATPGLGTLTVAFISGHKYLMRGSCGKGLVNYIEGLSYTGSGSDKGTGCIFIPNESKSTSPWMRYDSGSVFTNDRLSIQIFDLTFMFGASNEPSTVEEFEALYSQPYYPYNAGTLISNDASALETVGFNQWDEEWESGDYSGSNGEPVSTPPYVRCKNFIDVFPSTTYCISSTNNQGTSERQFVVYFYGSNKQFISYLSIPTSSPLFTTPANCRYIHFRNNIENSTYNHDICINLSDASKNGSYVPYWKRTLNLGLDSFEVKDGQGNVITITGGLKSAGSVYDEIVGNKYIKRIEEVDLGTLNWEYVEMYGIMASSTISGIATASTNIISEKYRSASVAGAGAAEDKSMYTRGDSTIGIKDSSYTSASQFKANMSGVKAYYELDTSIEYELADAIPCITQYSEYGTQRIISPQSSTPSAPFYGDWQYGIQQGDFISGLENSEFMIGSSTYIISEEEFNEIFGDL